ncbi:MAG: UDP-N-acetylmuramoyl-L-alanine--D-glutamate ligase [Bacteroidales bacterium]|nr:UDP-N-acetylmuramoyl-L-alanine--D-glutamate ligase [Bacteroidales bacterium]
MRLNPRVVILGAGESGVGAALLAQSKGIGVFVSDSGKIRSDYRECLVSSGIEFEEGKHSVEQILEAGEIIKSPGIPESASIIVSAREKGIKVIGEIEFASRYTNATKICITGSNGKTTTTMLTWHMLKSAGLNVGLAGNVGKSFAWQLAEKDHDYFVIELSSFQLDGMFDFKAEIGVLLNITPDHLDRYDHSFEKYAESKMRILRNQTERDSIIWCSDDETISRLMQNRELKQQSYQISIKNKIENGAYADNQKIVFNLKGGNFDMTLEELALQGKHNVYNSMAAGISSRLIDLRKETIKECLADFQNVEHRLEFVANIHGIEFINDSKATNINSVWYALESLNKNIIWIAGGIDKGNDYTKLFELVKQKVKAIICLGIDNEKLIDAFKDKVSYISETSSVEEAVELAYYLGRKGDVVLLSPACASFDLFENFEERGSKFKAAVNAL